VISVKTFFQVWFYIAINTIIFSPHAGFTLPVFSVSCLCPFECLSCSQMNEHNDSWLHYWNVQECPCYLKFGHYCDVSNVHDSVRYTSFIQCILLLHEPETTDHLFIVRNSILIFFVFTFVCLLKLDRKKLYIYIYSELGITQGSRCQGKIWTERCSKSKVP
jgi:hypothetical protein